MAEYTDGEKEVLDVLSEACELAEESPDGTGEILFEGDVSEFIDDFVSVFAKQRDE